jgi:uncharacterized protein YwbE
LEHQRRLRDHGKLDRRVRQDAQTALTRGVIVAALLTVSPQYSSASH